MRLLLKLDIVISRVVNMNEQFEKISNDDMVEFNVRYGQRLSRLESEVNNIQNAIESIATTIRDISNKLSDTQKAPWQTMIAAGSLIISIMSVVGYLSLAPVTATLEKQYHVQENFREKYVQDTSRIAILETQVSSLQSFDNNLDSMLQREMRLLDDALQREMRLLDAAQREKIDAIEAKQTINTADRYTASQATSDLTLVREEIVRLDEKIDDHSSLSAHSDIDRRVSRIEGILDQMDTFSRINGLEN